MFGKGLLCNSATCCFGVTAKCVKAKLFLKSLVYEARCQSIKQDIVIKLFLCCNASKFCAFLVTAQSWAILLCHDMFFRRPKNNMLSRSVDIVNRSKLGGLSRHCVRKQDSSKSGESALAGWRCVQVITLNWNTHVSNEKMVTCILMLFYAYIYGAQHVPWYAVRHAPGFRASDWGGRNGSRYLEGRTW